MDQSKQIAGLNEDAGRFYGSFTGSPHRIVYRPICVLELNLNLVHRLFVMLDCDGSESALVIEGNVMRDTVCELIVAISCGRCCGCRWNCGRSLSMKPVDEACR